MSELKHKLSALTEQLRNSEAVHYAIMYPRHIHAHTSFTRAGGGGCAWLTG